MDIGGKFNRADKIAKSSHHHQISNGWHLSAKLQTLKSSTELLSNSPDRITHDALVSPFLRGHSSLYPLSQNTVVGDRTHIAKM
jgi:hypothetical protein